MREFDSEQVLALMLTGFVFTALAVPIALSAFPEMVLAACLVATPAVVAGWRYYWNNQTRW